MYGTKILRNLLKQMGAGINMSNGKGLKVSKSVKNVLNNGIEESIKITGRWNQYVHWKGVKVCRSV